jgi:hypothetical protein
VTTTDPTPLDAAHELARSVAAFIDDTHDGRPRPLWELEMTPGWPITTEALRPLNDAVPTKPGPHLWTNRLIQLGVDMGRLSLIEGGPEPRYGPAVPYNGLTVGAWVEHSVFGRGVVIGLAASPRSVAVRWDRPEVTVDLVAAATLTCLTMP